MKLLVGLFGSTQSFRIVLCGSHVKSGYIILKNFPKHLAETDSACGYKCQ